MDKIINSNNSNYLKYIISPITPYFICDHHFSTEIYKGDYKYIDIDINGLLNENTNDLYLNKNFDKIKEGDIIQVQVDLFNLFVNDILPKISCKITIFTSQWHLPALCKNEITDKCLEDEKIILWISQNPIYENHNKYMAFPYGLRHTTLNPYMNFVKHNYKKIFDIDTKTNLCFNSPFQCGINILGHHIRRDPIFNNVRGKILPYDNYLNNILKSKFTISTSGDRDDCYRHYECIGLNSIPISNINYKEIFGNNMIYSNIDEILKNINGEVDTNFYFTDKKFLLIDYWRDKILLRLKNN
tara:strand:+ start:5781 stop:6680 length:900 start_codon:yes stop_codon:yes gene_type:complete